MINVYRDRIVAFVKRTWGNAVLDDPRERAARVVEEAIELGQATGLPVEQIRKIVERVYSRPVGTPEQEGAGVGLTLLAWTYTAGFDLYTLLEHELRRIEALPPDHFRAKHAEKVAAGTSTVESKP